MNQAQKRIVEVPVQFRGVVRVSVSCQLADDDAQLLAQHLALSRVLATTENVDAPDDEAFEEYHDACSSKAEGSAEEDWDGAKVDDPTGEWTPLESVVKERRFSIQSEVEKADSVKRQTP